MSVTEPQPAAPEPKRPGFQYSLTTLLLLFVVLASSLAVFGAAGIVVFVLAVGLAIYLHRVESLWSLTQLLLVVLCLMCLIGLLLPAVQSAGEAARWAQCTNNLKQIALALLNYESANGSFPPAYVADKSGKPMHSWRVLILPNLENRPLYNAYDFAEPWDGAKNKNVSATDLPNYMCPSEISVYAPGAMPTSYVAVVGRNAAWPGQKPWKPGAVDFARVASHTIILVEVANSGIPWAEPRDLSLDALEAAGAKLPALTVSSDHHPSEYFFFVYDHHGANVVTANGRVHYLPSSSLSTEHLRKILQVGGYREKESGSGDFYDDGRRVNWPNIAALAVWFLSVAALLYRAVRSRKARQGLPLVATSSRT